MRFDPIQIVKNVDGQVYDYDINNMSGKDAEEPDYKSINDYTEQLMKDHGFERRPASRSTFYRGGLKSPVSRANLQKNNLPMDQSLSHFSKITTDYNV